MLGPVRYPKRFLRGHALVAPVRAHKRVHVQGNVDPGAACSVSLIGLEEDDLVFSIGDGETSYVLRSTQAIIRSSSVSKLEFFYSFETGEAICTGMHRGAIPSRAMSAAMPGAFARATMRASEMKTQSPSGSRGRAGVRISNLPP